MADLLPSLAQRLLPRLGLEPSHAGGLREWVQNGVYQMGIQSTVASIVLERVQVTELVRFLAFDFERFSLASFESFATSSLERPYSIVSWPLLKLYYSGFFAAHAIMRSLGEGVVNLEDKQAELLSFLFDVTLGINPQLRGGAYTFRVQFDPAGSLSVTFEPQPKGGGVHDAFWASFKEFLERHAADAVSSKAPEAASFLSGVSEIVPILQRVRNVAWYSSMRNEINYQHKYGSWFPVGKPAKELLQHLPLARGASNVVRLDASMKKAPVELFVSGSHYLASLNSDVAEFIAARSTANNAFGSKWRRLKNSV